VYKYYTVNKTGELSAKTINLPADEFEFKQTKSDAPGSYFWEYLATNGENLILVKSYFKKNENTGKKGLLIQLAEVDVEGKISGNRQLFFEPKLTGDDRQFVEPTYIFNVKDQALILTGFMEIDKNKLNGLYLLKYDYSTASLIYNHEHNFNEILKPSIKSKAKVHYAIPEKINQVYPLKLRKEDLMIDYVNDFFSLRIITDFGFNATTFFEVKFDKYGDHIKTITTEYPGFINFFDDWVFNPTSFQMIWEDKTRPHVTASKPGPWDFVNTKANNKKSRVLWLPISTLKRNVVIRYDHEDKKVSAVLLD
jgi:hypothetical protein